MHFFILHVLHDPEKLEPMLQSWSEAGVKGVTVLQSIGMNGLAQQAGLREDMPLLPTLTSLFESGETLNRTLFTVVEGEDLMNDILQRTEQIAGDLNQPGTGILVVMPVLKALGLNRH